MKLRLSEEMSSMDLASVKMFTVVSVFTLILLRTDFRVGHVCIKTVVKNARESSQRQPTLLIIFLYELFFRPISVCFI